MSIHSHAYLVAGLRSPIGSFGGALKPMRATEYATIVAHELLSRHGVKPQSIDQVIGGMVLQDMTESNPARIVSQRIDIPDSVPAYTVNMQCCSGMLAFMQGVEQVALGASDVVLAIGMESMSNAPHMVPGSRWGHRLSDGVFVDTLKECTYAGSKMWGKPQYMTQVAEHHAEVDQVSREEMDEYTVVTHSRALDAIDNGRLKDEIVAIEVSGRKGGTKRFEQDENPRRDISVESLSKLNPVSPGGPITAGNAASINDGAAAALICNEAGLKKLGLDPLARIPLNGLAKAGCDPTLMGYSCVEAMTNVLKNTDMRVDDLDLIECNEGFAVQLLACERAGGWSRDRLNVDGGSVGLGHPVGMSGMRIVIHLANALHQRDLKIGAATVPAGSGLGTAVIVERV